MTPKAIHFLVYDYLRWGKSNEELEAELEKRGATYADLVSYIADSDYSVAAANQ